jgi:hypothetical protein
VLAKLLLKEIKNWFPKYKDPSNLKTWAKSIDDMIKLDQRSPEEIEIVIRWSQKDIFWRKNILSATTLRLKFNRLQAEILSTEKKGGPKKQEGIERASQKLKEAISGKQKGIEYKP